MSKKSVVLLMLLIIMPVVIYFIWPSDENRIKKLFREGSKAVEAEKIEDVMSKISFNYTDDHGLTYLFIKDGMEKAFRELSSVQVEYEIKDIRIKDEDAVAELDIRVIASSGKDAGYILGDAARPARIKFQLEKERTKWLVMKTEGFQIYY
jgi:hypothetical protein